MTHETDRRRFLLTAAAAGSAFVAGEAASAKQPAPTATKKPAAHPASAKPRPLETIRVGLVAAGDRGTYLLRILLGIEGVEVRAVCDPAEAKVARAQALVEERHHPKPAAYARSVEDYRRMCDRDDLDLVVSATPWPLHTPICLAALRSGKHVATEPPSALTVDEGWQQVEAAEKAGRQCMLLENYCYQRDVLMVWNMLRQGLFGEIMHVEGGYQKDTRDSELRLEADGTPSWQVEFRKDRKGNVYPTHDIGPLARWLEIHRGDRFEYLVSMGGNARALNEYGAQSLGPEHYLTTTRFDMSDINLCLIRTAKGRTIYLISDMLLARPQPRNVYRLLGSKGIYDRTLDKVYLEGKSPKRDRTHGDWEPVAKYYEEFDHPLWREVRTRALGSGYGASDFLCIERMLRAVRLGAAPDIDVCDAAAWSSIVELSERSARNRSLPVDFPDFTRGRWQTTPPAPLGA